MLIYSLTNMLDLWFWPQLATAGPTSCLFLLPWILLTKESIHNTIQPHEGQACACTWHFSYTFILTSYVQGTHSTSLHQGLTWTSYGWSHMGNTLTHIHLNNLCGTIPTKSTSQLGLMDPNFYSICAYHILSVYSYFKEHTFSLFVLQGKQVYHLS
jgi:hypothetical protein